MAEEKIEKIEVEEKVAKPQVSVESKPEVKPESKPKQAVDVDTIKVQFTQGVKFIWMGTIMDFRRGDITKVSPNLRDILLKRECVKLIT